MSHPLIVHMQRYVTIPSEDKDAILAYFQSQTYKKKEDLLGLNAVCHDHFFIVKGCVRLFFIKDNGVEQTIQFAIENWWITDYQAFALQMTTDYVLQAVEPTEVLRITLAKQNQLLDTYPYLERYFRNIYQRAYTASLTRTRFLYNFSKEEFYRHFNDHFPEFVSRVPQHLLASYLNMTPEYLSEIKRKTRT